MTAAGPDPDPLTRIAIALERIERSATVLAGAHDELKARHVRLREQVAGALADLDALITGRAEVVSD